MATARWGRDDCGRVVVYIQGVIDGERVQVRRRVPRDDEALAQRAVEAHEQNFLTGDLRILEDALVKRRRSAEAAHTPGIMRPAVGQSTTIAAWHECWMRELKGTIGEHSWRTYRSSTSSLLDIELEGQRFGDLPIDDVDTGLLLKLRAHLARSGISEATVGNKLRYLRRMFRDAVLAGVTSRNPLDTPLPRRHTKEARRTMHGRKITKRPLDASELLALLDVCRNPGRPFELQWWPLTESLLLTGLRWGEVAAWTWPAVANDYLAIDRAIEQYGSNENAGTKTGAQWKIPLRPPLRDLIRRQRARTYLGNEDGWIFPNSQGGALNYKNWRNRAWPRVLQKAKLSPSAGDAQKIFRKSYVTNALVCGRNPKRVATELGHASVRMITDQYELFLDDETWPGTSEVRQLADVYGWADTQSPHELAAIID